MNMLYTRIMFVFLVLCSGAFYNVNAQKFPSCSDLTINDFERTTYNVGRRPISVDFLKNADGTYDSYFALINGSVLRRNADGTQEQVAKLSAATLAYGGMTSFLFHPNFKNNGWVFTIRLLLKPGWTGPKVKGAYIARLSRHDFDPVAKKLSNEKVLLDMVQYSVKALGGAAFDRTSDTKGTYAYFQNGQMRFDSKGHLYANLGADFRSLESYSLSNDPKYLTSSGEARAADTKEYQGIIRIHPDSSSKGYSIPAGNFREYWENEFKKAGKTAIAAEYALSANKVLPEVYTKGHRTNWTLKIHPTKDWLIWGEVAVLGMYDEIGIVKHPIFGGFPYYYGDNEFTFKYWGDRTDVLSTDPGFTYDRGANGTLHPATRVDTNAPQNHSVFNEGVVNLPPTFHPQITSKRYQSSKGPVSFAEVGLKYLVIGKGQRVEDSTWFETSLGETRDIALPPVRYDLSHYRSITAGDIYAFNLRLNNPNKFPPHFGEHLFVFDWRLNVVDVAKVSEVGERIVVDTMINIKKILLDTIKINRVIDGTFTPDGTLLLSEEGGKIHHIKYVGNCVKIDLTPISKASHQANFTSQFEFTHNGVKVLEAGEYSLGLYNTYGKLVMKTQLKTQGFHAYSDLFKKVKQSNIYYLRVHLKGHSKQIPILLL